ncbi:hypothetical protein MCEGEM3_02457 [Oxalobacteraceae bacterium]
MRRDLASEQSNQRSLREYLKEGSFHIKLRETMHDKASKVLQH